MLATSWILKDEIKNLKEMVKSSMSRLHELKRQLANESFSFYWDGVGMFNSSSSTYIDSVIEEYEEFYEKLENTKDQGSYKRNRELFNKLQEDFKILCNRSEHFLRSDSKAVRKLGEDFIALGSNMKFEMQVKNVNLVAAEIAISELETEVSEVRTLASRLRDDKNELSNEVKNLKREKVELTDQTARLEEKNKGLSDVLQISEEQKKKLEDKTEELQGEKVELTGKVKKLEGENIGLSSVLQVSEKQKKKLEDKTEELQGKKVELTGEVKKLEGENIGLSSVLRISEEQKKKLEDKAEELQGRNIELTYKVARLEERNESLAATLQNSKKRKKELKDENIKFANEAENLKRQNKELSDILQISEEQKKKFEDKAGELQGKNIELTDKVARLEEEREGLIVTVRNNTEQLNEARELKREHEARIEELKKQVEVLTTRVGVLTTKVKTVQGTQEIDINRQIDYQQQEPSVQAIDDQQGTQASDIQPDQQQELSHRTANDPNVQSMFRSRSSSLSSSGSSNNGDQPGPSSILSGVQPISRSQSLSSDDGDIVIISRSQCR